MLLYCSLVLFPVPGDPPFSMVSYYTLPTNFYPFDEQKTPREWHKMSKMFERFVDIPISGDSPRGHDDQTHHKATDTGAAAAAASAAGAAGVTLSTTAAGVVGTGGDDASGGDAAPFADSKAVPPPAPAQTWSPYFTKPAPKSWAA